MVYVPTAWEDSPSVVTPITAARLNNMEAGIVEGIAAGGGGGGLDYEGAYNAGTAYVAGDVVLYNGVQYAAVNPSTGQTPPPVAAQGASIVPLVTALPTPLFDGQEVIFTDSLTAPTYQWHLRYVAAKASNKWVFLGGAEAVSDVGALQLCPTGAVWSDLTTSGPAFTVPVTGEYLVQASVAINAGTGIPDTPTFGVTDNGGGTPPQSVGGEVNRANLQTTGFFAYRRTLTAGWVPRMRYLSYVATTAFGSRVLTIVPRAVGG